MKKKGLLIIFSGPSGVGKGTILRRILPMKDLKLCFSVSMTTRKPRKGEVDGKDYFFVSKERFEEAIKKKELIEYAQYVGNYYGTPLKYVEEMRNKGKNIILDIETKGAKKIIKKYGDDVMSIYLLPPSMKELKNRLIHRGTEDMETINKRIAKTRRQLKDIDCFNYKVVNVDRDATAGEIRDLIKAEMAK